MLRKIILTVGALSVSVLFSCSNGGGSVSTSEPAPVYGTAQLGNLAEASVEIYELTDNGSPVLKWTETTSSGETLDEIGKFNTHAGEMEDEKYYIIKITGGQDWDTDDNGLIDSLPTDNKGTIRLIASGKNIKSTENLKVTMISEIIYEKVAKYIKYDYSKENLAQKIDDAVEQVVEDTNGDGQVDIYDVITFDPVKHKPKLKGIYKREFVNIVSVIHSGKDAFSAVKASLNIGSLDIESYAVALSDFMTIACIASGTSGLQIVDISTPSSPTILSTLVPTTNGIYLVTLSPDGKIAYVTEGTTDKQLEIIDISNPNNPQILSSAPYDTPGSITYMKVSEINGKLYAFIADYDGGLQILNVSDPNNISTVGSLPSTDVSNTVGLTMSKNKDKLFIVSGTSLYIVDISDLANPSIIGYVDTPGTAKSVVLSYDEQTAYIADYSEGIQIIDLSDLSNPTIVHNIPITQTAEYVFISPDKTKLYVEDSLLRLHVFQIDNPKNPVALGYIPLTAILYQNGIAFSKDGTKMYTASGITGFKILDITEISNPAVIGYIHMSFNSTGMALSPDETKIYITPLMGGAEIGLSAIDVTDPTNPYIISSKGFGGYIYSIVLSESGNTAYVPSGGISGLYILDITDPNNISIRGFFGATSYVTGVSLSPDETKAYITTNTSTSTLQIVDITDPTNPSAISSIDLFAPASKVITSKDGSTIYVITELFSGDSKLWILDVLSPDAPYTIGSLNIAGKVNSIALSNDGTKIYLANNDNGLKIVDITDPTTPYVLSSIDTDGTANHLVCSKNGIRVYIADGDGGLQIINVSNSLVPFIEKSIYFPDYVNLVAVPEDETKAYIFTKHGELLVVGLDLIE